MKPSTILLIVIAAAVSIIIFYSLSPGTVDKDYAAMVDAERKERDVFMQKDENSPLIKSTEPFTGLQYFPVDPAFRISANLEPVEERKPVLLTTNDGLEKTYLEYGYATFSFDGVDCKLLILEVMESGPFRGTLFLAFADATSAFETYGAGRYLDVIKTPGATNITLDFNKAYNPFCAYSDDFSCPFPPKENVLKVAIKAGEKVYHEH